MNKRKEATARQWAALYDAAASVRKLEPWKHLAIDNLVVIELEEGKEPVFCSAMVSEDGCGSVAVYEGNQGYEDIQTLMDIRNHGAAYARFALAHQNCLALHFCEREAVPPEQKERIKQLGLRFRGKGNWPVFLSMKSRFAPYGMDRREVICMTKALQGYVMAIRSYVEGGLLVQWEAGESIFRMYHQESKLWINIPHVLPEADRIFPGVEITDELLKKRLQKLKKTKTEVVMDLVYMDEAVVDDEYDRPVNPLLFVAVDKKSGMILDMGILKPDQPEAQPMMEFMLGFMMENGCVKSVTASNMWLLSPLATLSKICGFKLIEGNDENMEPLEEAMDAFFEMMSSGEMDEMMEAMMEEMLEAGIDDAADDEDFDGPF